MTPHHFPEANVAFSAPPDLSEEQVKTIAGYVGQVKGGSMDGSTICVVAWKPTTEELARLVRGEPLFLSFSGGLPPHFPCVSFNEAIQPA